MVDFDWDGLEQVLRGRAHVTDEECAYLRKAFVVTERMWAENVAKIATVRFVMSSEAPQFGPNERYFYNIATPFSSFFYFQDAEAILGRDFAKLPRDKRFLLQELASAGFIVLGLFPSALNKDDTPSITYNIPTRRYQELFQRTAERYFDRKLDLILRLGGPLFLFRYERMKDQLGDLVDAMLAKRNIGPTQGSVGGTNMPLDREKLTQIWHAAQIARVVADQ